jgi:hypothetical protein
MPSYRRFWERVLSHERVITGAGISRHEQIRLSQKIVSWVDRDLLEDAVKADCEIRLGSIKKLLRAGALCARTTFAGSANTGVNQGSGADWA